VVCVMAVVLSACAQKSDTQNLAGGGCSTTQSGLVKKHISGQIDSFATKDWKRAYSFASEGFRKSVNIQQFILIIANQYSMLVENQGYKFGKCAYESGKITQEVQATSNDKVYYITYLVSIKGTKLGIEAAVVGVANTLLTV